MRYWIVLFCLALCLLYGCAFSIKNVGGEATASLIPTTKESIGKKIDSLDPWSKKILFSKIKGPPVVGEIREFIVKRPALSEDKVKPQDWWKRQRLQLEKMSIKAGCVAINDEAYFFAENGLEYKTYLPLILESTSRDFPAIQAIFGKQDFDPDQDPKVYILLCKIPLERYLPGTAPLPTIDTASLSLTADLMLICPEQIERYGENWQDYLCNVVAHEYQHILLFSHYLRKDIWIVEGLAEVTTLLLGYTPESIGRLWPPDNFFAWMNHPQNYAAARNFFEFLCHRFGGDKVLKKIMCNPYGGKSAVSMAVGLPWDVIWQEYLVYRQNKQSP